jgi:hypothetical protein
VDLTEPYSNRDAASLRAQRARSGAERRNVTTDDPVRAFREQISPESVGATGIEPVTSSL